MTFNANKTKKMHILIAEDDLDDQLMTREALSQNDIPITIQFVEDGEALLTTLAQLFPNNTARKTEEELPNLILLDLNMPRKNGLETLRELKSNPKLRHIPVVVLTTSKTEEDIYRAYDLGVNSFLTKPMTYTSLINMIKILGKYWFEVIQLPPNRD